MNIFEEIRKDHEVQRDQIEQLVNTQGDSAERREVWKKLKAELEGHAIAEERYFYSPMIAHDRTQELARHSIAEHHELDELIETLETTDLSAPKWLITARELQKLLVHHLDEEEHEIFQQAGHVLTDKDKVKLAQQFRGYRNAT